MYIRAVIGRVSFRCSAAVERAQASAASTSSTVRSGSEPTGWLFSTAATVSTMSTKASSPVRNASTQTSLAAL